MILEGGWLLIDVDVWLVFDLMWWLLMYKLCFKVVIEVVDLFVVCGIGDMLDVGIVDFWYEVLGWWFYGG